MTRRLVGAAELQHLFGVSRKRAYDISRRPDFPSPVAELVMGNIWELPDIETWAGQVGRALHPLPEQRPAAGA